MIINSADKLYLGENAIDRVYVGTNRVWPAGFDPTSIPGLKLWLEADRITASNGAAVNAWPDISGNEFNASYVGAAPTFHTNQLNGHPVLRFNAGSGQRMRLTYTTSGGNAQYTMFVVARLTGGANGRVVGSIYPNNRNWLLGWWNGYERVMYGEGFVVPGSTGASANWHQYTAKGTGALTSVWEKGVLIDSNGSGLASPNGGITLSGYSPTGTEELSNCEIAVVGLWEDVNMSTIDRQAVEAALIEKYGL